MLGKYPLKGGSCMRFKKRVSARVPKKARKIGFSNEKFLGLMADLTGIQPVGNLGRETPLDLTSLERARGSLLMRELFSKYDDRKRSPEKEAKTWERFHGAELSCHTANQRIAKWSLNHHPKFWGMVAARIRDALGRFDWDECSKFFAFGPGATTRLPRASSYAAYKYSGIPESTSGNARLASVAIAMVPLWKQSVSLLMRESSDDPVRVVDGNRVIAVPKNYKTDRTIAKEPCMNIYVQKGIGRVIRHRLKRLGVDLDDQTRNQRAAREGSEREVLATIDLSMASDTLPRELVHWLLPPEWVWALEQARSPVGVLPSGQKIHYQKFSSMGNGYTFELESLVFWAIVQECILPFNINETDSSVCVYGDDLVVPSAHYGTICERLLEAGFTPNPDKSFASGPYRESCGKHYYLGSDVTPFYVRKPVESLDRLFLVHNNVYRWGVRTGTDVSAVLNKLRELAPASWREPRLPDGYGDGAFIGSVDEIQMDSHPHGWEFWQVKALSRMAEELADNLPDGQLLVSLMASSTKDHKRKKVSDPNLAKVGLTETLSGLPAREGQYREIDILIPRHSPA
jgi:hypothetical protein